MNRGATFIARLGKKEYVLFAFHQCIQLSLGVNELDFIHRPSLFQCFPEPFIEMIIVCEDGIRFPFYQGLYGRRINVPGDYLCGGGKYGGKD